jgi:hypothetical protein
MRNVFFISCFTFLNACGLIDNASSRGFHWYEPRPLFMQMIEDKSPWGDGWRDGCKGAIGIPGEGAIRFNKYQYDVNRGIEDKEYYAGFRAGTDTCVFYISPGIN